MYPLRRNLRRAEHQIGIGEEETVLMSLMGQTFGKGPVGGQYSKRFPGFKFLETWIVRLRMEAKKQFGFSRLL